MADEETSERIAALEARVAELEAKVSASAPKLKSDWEEQERAAREYYSQVHNMREKNASHISDSMRRGVGIGVSNVDAWDLRTHGSVPSRSTMMGGQAVIDVPEVRTDQGGRWRPLPLNDAAIDAEARWRLAMKNRP